MSEQEPPGAQTTPSRSLARTRRIALVMVAVVAFVVGCNTLAGRLAVRANNRAPRNPDTGILIGAEPRDLGPVDAPVAVLFVHGFVGAGNNFADLPDRVAAEGSRVRVMRLPGHGTSPHDLKRVTADELLMAVFGEIEALRADHDQVVLVGHSMGGALCTLAAAEIPVDGLVLGGAYFGVTYRWYYVLPPETWMRLTAPVVRWMYKGKLFMQVNRDEAKDHIVSYVWTPSKAGITLTEVGRRAAAPETLARVTCPVLMLHGRNDVAASPAAADLALIQMGSTDKRLVWLERSNHHVFWDYDAEQVMREIVEFTRAVVTGTETRQANPPE